MAEDLEQAQGDEPPRILTDPSAQERQLSKMASEIEALRSQIEELAQQNKMLLDQQQKTLGSKKEGERNSAEKSRVD